eukprot:CAMPEP_0170509798 /NCGR_PEP_ID=MMETSP0208-20121228/65414_1 /TAXON_ID=197538 /ORGANISM="Strombidium inclinatum, Strain S3" /LENGTH=84 /DNA_ID=CAMNT_0010793193 /DNA_START=2946 /DNA_END=3200 /DNA_ORIENTATION=-
MGDGNPEDAYANPYSNQFINREEMSQRFGELPGSLKGMIPTTLSDESNQRIIGTYTQNEILKDMAMGDTSSANNDSLNLGISAD